MIFDKSKIMLISCFVAGSISFVSLAFFALFSFENLTVRLIHSLSEIRQNSIIYRLWKQPPLMAYHRIYFFNITNANDVLENGAKPSLQEVGPFTYRFTTDKTDVVFNKNGTISYRRRNTWYFQRHLSVADEHVELVTLNTPIALAMGAIQEFPIALRNMITMVLKQVQHELFVRKTVRDITFDGFSSPIMRFAPLLSKKYADMDGKFGYFWPLNNSVDSDLYTTNAGHDIHKMSLVDRINGESSLQFWNGSECNRLNGSTVGENWAPLTSDDTVIRMYSPPFCRSLQLNRNKTFVTKEGFKTEMFTIDENAFRNATDYPPNKCYTSRMTKEDSSSSSSSSIFWSLLSTPKQREQRQFPAGVMDISQCLYGAPLLLSRPHFLYGDSSYSEAVDGLKPSPQHHDTFFAVEPMTGFTLSLEYRFQLNVFLNAPSGLTQFSKLPKIALPVLWSELSVEWPDLYRIFAHFVFFLPQIVRITSFIVFFTLGAIFLFTSSRYLSHSQPNKFKSDHYIFLKANFA